MYNTISSFIKRLVKCKHFLDKHIYVIIVLNHFEKTKQLISINEITHILNEISCSTVDNVCL